MAKRNQVQFQRGLGPTKFLDDYGTGKQCAEAPAERIRMPLLREREA
ncbi:MAG: hypothetical protein OXI01_05130 [Albidovulum sp.]|nr:hypothetical protein [Albidovulum sp.]